MKHTAYAPASIGNVSLGFDILGAALAPIDGSDLGDKVVIEQAGSFTLDVAGDFAHKLPQEQENNIVSHCYHAIRNKLAEHKPQLPAAKMTLFKNLPIGSGLGSSASSVVAALHGLNEFYGQPLNDHELLLLMGELEGQISGSVHYDNVAPCFLGGLTLMVEAADQLVTSLPIIDEWYWTVCYSGITVSTAAAREILPKSLALETALTFGRQLAVFVDALHRNDAELAAEMMRDVIAEPHRKGLLPGFDKAREFAIANGALAFGISGSGPTVFAVSEQQSQAEAIAQWLEQNYVQNQDGFSRVCKLDPIGSKVVREN